MFVNSIKYSLIILPLILHLAAGNAHSEQGSAKSLMELSIDELMDVRIISASKRGESHFATPSAVHVITNDEIRRSGATNIPEALRLAPGLHVARKDMNHYVVTSRGFNDLPFSDKLLVMIDGRALHSPTFSQVWWPAIQYPLEDIERIEVIRGPGSAVWGANATNGVINIITKDSADTKGALVSALRGNKELASAVFRYGWDNGESRSTRVYGMGGETGGASGVSGEWDDAPRPRTPWHNYKRTYQAGLKTDWDYENKKRTFQLNSYQNSAEAEGSVFWQYGSGTRHYTNNDKYSGTNLLYSVEKEGYDLTTSYQIFYDRTNIQRVYFQETLDTVDGEAQIIYSGFKNSLVTSGVNFRYTRSDFTDTIAMEMPDSSFNLFGLFVQDEIMLMNDRLKFVIGVKAEKNSYTGWEFQPNVKTAWIEDKWMAWASASRAVRLTNTVNNNLKWKIEQSGINNIYALGQVNGKGNVHPDDLLAYEAGIRVKPSSNFGIDLSAFHNHYLNVMDLTSNKGDAVLLTSPINHYLYDIEFTNMYEGQSYGGELALDAKPASWARIFLAYARTHVDIKPKTGYESKLEEASWTNTATPINSSKARVSIDLRHDLEFDASGYFVDWAPGVGGQRYARFDLRVAYRPIENLEISIVGRNLAHQRHKEYESQYMEEISWVERDGYLKLSYEF